MSVSDRMEQKLKENLEKRITPPNEEVKASFIAVILPIVIDILSRLMDNCNNTPERAAKIAKRMGVWTRRNIRKGVESKEQLSTCQTECCEAIKDTIKEATEEELASVVKEHDEESFDWSPLGV